MSKLEQVKQDFLQALAEPEYARVDFWQSKQSESGLSNIVYLKMLMDACKFYQSQINNQQFYYNSLGNQVSDIKLPLHILTGGYMSGHLGYSELQSLLTSIKDLSDYWFPEQCNKESIQPIKWLKSDEALRQLIEALKENGLIQSRETEDIIQHFEVSGREAKQAKLEPINWLKSKALLAYLIDMLSKEPEPSAPSAPFMDSIKKWELVKLHFVVKGKKITRSLVSDLKQTMYPNGCTDIDDILKRLPVH